MVETIITATLWPAKAPGYGWPRLLTTLQQIVVATDFTDKGEISVVLAADHAQRIFCAVGRNGLKRLCLDPIQLAESPFDAGLAAGRLASSATEGPFACDNRLEATFGVLDQIAQRAARNALSLGESECGSIFGKA